MTKTVLQGADDSMLANASTSSPLQKRASVGVIGSDGVVFVSHVKHAYIQVPEVF